VLDFRFAGRGADNRWNDEGVPTLYLAGDEGVLIAEWGGNFATIRTPQLDRRAVERSVFRLELAFDNVLDLRRGEVCQALSLLDAPACFMNIAVARATAQFVRTTTAAQAMLVPSIGFLDDLERWCLVVFLEKLPPTSGSFVSSVTEAGPLRWG
jgi:RES domain-containing protein